MLVANVGQNTSCWGIVISLKDDIESFNQDFNLAWCYSGLWHDYLGYGDLEVSLGRKEAALLQGVACMV